MATWRAMPLGLAGALATAGVLTAGWSMSAASIKWRRDTTGCGSAGELARRLAKALGPEWSQRAPSVSVRVSRTGGRWRWVVATRLGAHDGWREFRTASCDDGLDAVTAVVVLATPPAGDASSDAGPVASLEGRAAAAPASVQQPGKERRAGPEAGGAQRFDPTLDDPFRDLEPTSKPEPEDPLGALFAVDVGGSHDLPRVAPAVGAEGLVLGRSFAAGLRLRGQAVTTVHEGRGTVDWLAVDSLATACWSSTRRSPAFALLCAEGGATWFRVMSPWVDGIDVAGTPVLGVRAALLWRALRSRWGLRLLAEGKGYLAPPTFRASGSDFTHRPDLGVGLSLGFFFLTSNSTPMDADDATHER